MQQKQLPNATLVLVFGIISIVLCWCYGIIGLPLGIVAIILGNKAIKVDQQQPDVYLGVQNAKIGKILGIIGVILNLLFIAYIVWILSLIGWDALGDPELMMERAKELEEKMKRG